MKRCPNCGGITFAVIAHVTQLWKVDGNENYIETVEDYMDTTHRPDDDDMWECWECGYEATGRELNVRE